MYNKAYRAMVVQKATGPNAPTLEALAEEFDASLASIYRWVKAAATVEPELDVPDVEPIYLPKPIKMKRPQDWSPEEKLAAVLEAASLTDTELGAFLRNKGLHEAHLQQWREQMLSGLKPMPMQNKKNAIESKRIRELEKDLRRKEKALAETAALLVLKKKAREIWGDEDDDTDS
jgi:transposase-like protein